MSRPLRPDIHDAWYHVTHHGIRDFDVFEDDADRQDCLNYLRRATAAEGTSVVAYCFMGNHLHTVVYCPTGGLSRTMQRFGSTYTRSFNRHHGLRGPLFCDRFASVLIDSDTQLIATVRYAVRNPLELSYRIDDYPWSSHRAYLTNEVTPWARPDLVLPLIGSAEEYRALVEQSLPSDKFSMSDGVRSYRQRPSFGALGLLEHMIEERPAPDEAARRDALLVLAHERRLASTSELSSALGMPSAGATRAARSRASRRLGADQQFAAYVASLRAELLRAA